MKLQFIILIMISLLITSVLIILLVKRTNIVIISLTTLYLIILFSLFSIDNGKLKRILRKEVIVDIPLPEFMMKKGEEEPKEVEDIIKEVNQPSKKVDTIKKEILLDAPIIKQFPELPRGCEVTSLAMFLQYYQVKTDKMELAKK